MYKHVVALLLISFSFIVVGQNKEEKSNPYDLLTKYYEEDFEPFAKGNWYLGFAFSLQDRKQENFPRLLDQVIESQEIGYNITLSNAYFIGDYSSIGLNFNYDRDDFTGTLINQNGDTLSRNQVGFTANFIPNLRTYFPLTKTGRLSFYNQIDLGFGYGNALRRDITDVDLIDKTYSTSFIFTAGLSPGITFFAIENFAFEIQLSNLLGYRYQKVTSSTNEMEESVRETNNVSFQIDLLSLRLGLAYFFGANKANK